MRKSVIEIGSGFELPKSISLDFTILIYLRFADGSVCHRHSLRCTSFLGNEHAMIPFFCFAVSLKDDGFSAGQRVQLPPPPPRPRYFPKPESKPVSVLASAPHTPWTKRLVWVLW